MYFWSTFCYDHHCWCSSRREILSQRKISKNERRRFLRHLSAEIDKVSQEILGASRPKTLKEQLVFFLPKLSRIHLRRKLTAQNNNFHFSKLSINQIEQSVGPRVWHRRNFGLTSYRLEKCQISIKITKSQLAHFKGLLKGNQITLQWPVVMSRIRRVTGSHKRWGKSNANLLVLRKSRFESLKLYFIFEIKQS